ncbi:hypothetical protein SAMN05421538_1065 [Paracoccus isoporae]|uniref:Uncharacterized protein n=1 Tax=Paracoccus isoporae TaxID=591205 RepID=A0A1G7C6T6_9RHOB|nr:hypothetical protein [Paracoccus isoporae]SDE35007.1 hypothetical protein SAMN05421538_1065 [Paracoccus isoporae]
MTKLLTAAAAAGFALLAALPASAGCTGVPHDKSAETSEPVVIPKDVNA